MRCIIAREHGLSFEGHPEDGKTLAEHLRELSNASGMDLTTTLNDFVYNIEVEYQLYYGKDEDDFGW